MHTLLSVSQHRVARIVVVLAGIICGAALSTAMTTEVLINGGAEDGMAGWSAPPFGTQCQAAPFPGASGTAAFTAAASCSTFQVRSVDLAALNATAAVPEVGPVGLTHLTLSALITPGKAQAQFQFERPGLSTIAFDLESPTTSTSGFVVSSRTVCAGSDDAAALSAATTVKIFIAVTAAGGAIDNISLAIAHGPVGAAATPAVGSSLVPAALRSPGFALSGAPSCVWSPGPAAVLSALPDGTVSLASNATDAVAAAPSSPSPAASDSSDTSDSDSDNDDDGDLRVEVVPGATAWQLFAASIASELITGAGSVEIRGAALVTVTLLQQSSASSSTSTLSAAGYVAVTSLAGFTEVHSHTVAVGGPTAAFEPRSFWAGRAAVRVGLALINVSIALGRNAAVRSVALSLQNATHTESASPTIAPSATATHPRTPDATPSQTGQQSRTPTPTSNMTLSPSVVVVTPTLLVHNGPPNNPPTFELVTTNLTLHPGVSVTAVAQDASDQDGGTQRMTYIADLVPSGAAALFTIPPVIDFKGQLACVVGPMTDNLTVFVDVTLDDNGTALCNPRLQTCPCAGLDCSRSARRRLLLLLQPTPATAPPTPQPETPTPTTASAFPSAADAARLSVALALGLVLGVS